MEKILKHHDKERVKRAMLEQEETFRLQVHELHRLYRVQKHLMREMKANRFTREQCAPPGGMLDLELPAEAYITEKIEAECEIELTLAIGRGGRKREETSNTSDSAGSFSSSSAESGNLKLLSSGHGWGISKVQEMCLASKSERNFEFDVEHKMRQEIAKPLPWRLPCLSLTMS